MIVQNFAQQRPEPLGALSTEGTLDGRSRPAAHGPGAAGAVNATGAPNAAEIGPRAVTPPPRGAGRRQNFGWLRGRGGGRGPVSGLRVGGLLVAVLVPSRVRVREEIAPSGRG
ncbi:hypothetical protein GCM10010315_30350 [Streptomyces luteosporeus]|uniref:Uncharacterized protein n=1 Tax=Streptomyces luteosporeus TaxID=173856 RepID=A0ABN3TSF8_9ACTN